MTMALGALIGAYQEDESGGLRALLPLAGRTLIEYQARCLAAAGAAPLIVLVERVPPALNEAFERLRGEGIAVVPVSDGNEAASRFEAGSQLILLADGIAPDMGDLELRADEGDERDHRRCPTTRRMPGLSGSMRNNRWAGLARVDGQYARRDRGDARRLGLAVDLAAARGPGRARALIPSRAARARGRSWPAARRPWPGSSGGCWSPRAAARDDWVSRYLLPMVEEIATERLMETRRAAGLAGAGRAGADRAAAFCFTRGWHWRGAGPAGPVDPARPGRPAPRAAAVAAARARQCCRAGCCGRRRAWPCWRSAGSRRGTAAAGARWWPRLPRRLCRGGADRSAAGRAAGGAVAISPAATRSGWRSPFAIGGWWNAYLALLALYAATSFFLAQHFRHR